jgi:PKD repeat protein
MRAGWGPRFGGVWHVKARHWRALSAAVFGAALIGLALSGTASAHLVRKPDGQLVGRLSPATVHPSTASPHHRGETQGLLEYKGGPLMLKSTLYAIFWAPASHPFPVGYETAIIQYLKDLAASSTAETTATNDWSVAEQYENAAHERISGSISYGGAYTDTKPYPNEAVPTLNCIGDVNTEPCINGEEEIKQELEADITAERWPAGNPEANPTDQYLVFTPPKVDSCEELAGKSCTYTEKESYCAYHASFSFGAGTNKVVWSNMPYEPGCDSGQAPTGVSAAGASAADADGTLDSLIHELLESATDPGTTNAAGYVDSAGNEIGDKCTGPVIVVPEPGYAESTYGMPLGGSLSAKTAFNELVNGHQYYVQAMWSNAPAQTPALPGSPAAGCVQRGGPSPDFATPSGTLSAQLAVKFDASNSYDLEQPLTKYEWNFGDGAIDTTSGATPSHVYAAPGTYTVKLTVSDERGAADSSTEELPVTVGPAQASASGGSSGSGGTSGGGASTGGTSGGTSGTAGTGSTSTPNPPPPLPLEPARLASFKAPESHGLVSLKLVCAPDTRCEGALRLLIAISEPAKGSHAHRRRRRHRVLRLELGSYDVQGGASSVVRVKLSSSALHLLLRDHRLVATIEIEAPNSKPVLEHVTISAPPVRHRAKRKRR